MSKQVTPPPPGDRPNAPAPPPPPGWRHWLFPLALIVMLALWFVLPALPGRGVPTHSLTYSQFLSDVSARQIKTVRITSTGTASGTLVNGHDYTTVIPVQLAGSGLLDRLQATGVQITAAAPGPSFGSQVLSWAILLLPFLFILWIWRRLSRTAVSQMQGVMRVGRSRAKVFDAERPATIFADVAGYEGAKAEIAEVVDFLRQPGRPARGADGRPAWNRQDAAGPCCGRGGRGAVLLGRRGPENPRRARRARHDRGHRCAIRWGGGHCSHCGCGQGGTSSSAAGTSCSGPDCGTRADESGSPVLASSLIRQDLVPVVTSYLLVMAILGFGLCRPGAAAGQEPCTPASRSTTSVHIGADTCAPKPDQRHSRRVTYP